MPPKPGNAFAQQKEPERLKQAQKQFENEGAKTGTATEVKRTSSGPGSDDAIKTTTLEVPTTSQDDAPSTAATNMATILGPETEREKHGRKIVQQQRESMEAKIMRKRSHKSRRSTDSSRGSVKHPSAMPAPLFRGKFGQVINIFKGKKAEAPAVSDATVDKPLPGISSPEAAYAQAHGTYIPGAYMPSPGPIQGSMAMRASPTFGPIVAFNPTAQPFYPDEYAPPQSMQTELGWPLPSCGPAAGHLSAQTFETSPSQYLSSGNSGMIFSNHFLTPTRAGDYAAFGQPKIVHPPSMMSVAASFVDPQSPVNAPAGQRASNVGVIPEVQETKAQQAASASDVEKLYNQGSEDSQSEQSPVRARPSVADPTIDTLVVATPAPRIPHSRSMPNISIAPFSVEPAAATHRASTGTNAVFLPFATRVAAAVDSSTQTPAVPVSVTLAAYAQLGKDVKLLHTDLAARIKSTRRATAKDLMALYDCVRGLSRDDTLAFLESRMHTLDARTQRIEDKLDAIIDGLSLRGLVRRRVMMPAASAASGAGRGAGMEGRLAAPGPHTPWGSQSLNVRERELSAGIGGGLEGVQAWYRAARRA